MTSSDPLQSATTGRQFHLEAILGAGAFGEVYLAEQDSGAGFRRRVALKLLHADLQKTKEAAMRMRDEARMLGLLRHRSIVTVLDLVKLGDRWAIVMDYVPGADLEQVLKAIEKTGEAFPAPAALEICAEVLDALDAAFHAVDEKRGVELKVVHRDIKPSNVRLTATGEVKVLDFGVARVNMDAREAKTRAEGWIGTERYMAPERILCEGDTPAGDVYAVMASLVELLLTRPLGRTPVLEDRHTPWIEEQLEQIRPLLKGSPEDVESVLECLRNGLHASPDVRRDARSLSDQLSRLARRLEGATLREFARQFVPTVTEVLGADVQPVSGVLSEQGSTDPTGLTIDPLGSSKAGSEPTFLPPPTEEEPIAPPRSRGWLFAGAGAVVVIVALAVVMVASGTAAVVVGLWGINTAPPPEAAVSAPEPPTPAPTAPAVEPDAKPEDVATAPSPPVPLTPPERLVRHARPEPPTPPAAPTTEVPEVPAVAAPPPPPPVPAVAAADAPRVRTKFTAKDAISMEVNCGGTVAAGTMSVSMRSAPLGSCTVTATIGGRKMVGSVDLKEQGGWDCAAEGDSLRCKPQL